ncbi:MAG: NAD-dependent epimerase/dehydratase family protein [Methanobacteriota archaeon]|nr:MAG: NAD-dependent epimerase/dehydratase family protein [Euryarchaeota archaeon]
MRYFVTGATGFIGKRLVRRLHGAGHAVDAIARDPSKAGDLTRSGVRVHKGDITDKDSMRRPMAGVDGVFHLAAWYKIGAKDKSPAVRSNIDGTRNVLELMEELGIRKGVYTSTLAIFGDTKGQVVDESYRHNGPWLSEYDRTKWVAHYEVAEPMMKRGLPLVIVQPGVTYGPGDPSAMGITLREYLERKLRGVPKISSYCWGHVEDTAAAHILAMDRGEPGESYIVAGEPKTLIDAIEMAERITGIPAPNMRPSPGLVRFLAAITRSELLRVSAGATYLGSNAKAKRELGLRHRPLEEGLHETLFAEMKALGIPAPG